MFRKNAAECRTKAGSQTPQGAKILKRLTIPKHDLRDTREVVQTSRQRPTINIYFPRFMTIETNFVTDQRYPWSVR